MHGVRYGVELVVGFALLVRGCAYLWVASVVAVVRTAGAFDAWTGDSGEVMHWHYLAPGFEHDQQTKWEIRYAGFACLLAGVALYHVLALLASGRAMLLLYANTGVLVLEPAWTELYFAIADGDQEYA